MIDINDMLDENARLRTEINRLRSALAEIWMIAQLTIPPPGVPAKPVTYGSIMDISSDVAD